MVGKKKPVAVSNLSEIRGRKNESVATMTADLVEVVKNE